MRLLIKATADIQTPENHKQPDMTRNDFPIYTKYLMESREFLIRDKVMSLKCQGSTFIIHSSLYIYIVKDFIAEKDGDSKSKD